jgi:hypothetical protein
MTRVVAFDPGVTTGFVSANWIGGKDFDLLDVEKITWDDRFGTVKNLLRFSTPDHVVIEDFRLYHHRMKSQIGKDFPSVQMIGIIQTYCYEMDLLDRITMQPASVRSNVKIADEHLLMVGASPHIQDAYKHLRYFIIVNLLRKGVQP